MVKLFISMALIDVIAMEANKRCAIIVHPANGESSVFVITEAVCYWSVVCGITHEKKTRR